MILWNTMFSVKPSGRSANTLDAMACRELSVDIWLRNSVEPAVETPASQPV